MNSLLYNFLKILRHWSTCYTLIFFVILHETRNWRNQARGSKNLPIICPFAFSVVRGTNIHIIIRIWSDDRLYVVVESVCWYPTEWKRWPHRIRLKHPLKQFYISYDKLKRQRTVLWQGVHDLDTIRGSAKRCCSKEINNVHFKRRVKIFIVFIPFISIQESQTLV